jgi:hypothetical protein
MGAVQKVTHYMCEGRQLLTNSIEGISLPLAKTCRLVSSQMMSLIFFGTKLCKGFILNRHTKRLLTFF